MSLLIDALRAAARVFGLERGILPVVGERRPPRMKSDWRSCLIRSDGLEPRSLRKTMAHGFGRIGNGHDFPVSESSRTAY